MLKKQLRETDFEAISVQEDLIVLIFRCLLLILVPLDRLKCACRERYFINVFYA